MPVYSVVSRCRSLHPDVSCRISLHSSYPGVSWCIQLDTCVSWCIPRYIVVSRFMYPVVSRSIRMYLIVACVHPLGPVASCCVPVCRGVRRCISMYPAVYRCISLPPGVSGWASLHPDVYMCIMLHTNTSYYAPTPMGHHVVYRRTRFISVCIDVPSGASHAYNHKYMLSHSTGSNLPAGNTHTVHMVCNGCMCGVVVMHRNMVTAVCRVIPMHGTP